MHLEETFLLDMENRLHRVALYLVFHSRIQKSLDTVAQAWNNHRLRGKGNKSPDLLWDLSRSQAIREGYWTGDPGDELDVASLPHYGVEDVDDNAPPQEELDEDPDHVQEETEDGTQVNSDDELEEARQLLSDFDFGREDGNWGIEVYVQAVLRLQEVYPDEAGDDATQDSE